MDDVSGKPKRRMELEIKCLLASIHIELSLAGCMAGGTITHIQVKLHIGCLSCLNASTFSQLREPRNAVGGISLHHMASFCRMERVLEMKW